LRSRPPELLGPVSRAASIIGMRPRADATEGPRDDYGICVRTRTSAPYGAALNCGHG